MTKEGRELRREIKKQNQKATKKINKLVQLKEFNGIGFWIFHIILLFFLSFFSSSSSSSTKFLFLGWKNALLGVLGILQVILRNIESWNYSPRLFFLRLPFASSCNFSIAERTSISICLTLHSYFIINSSPFLSSICGKDLLFVLLVLYNYKPLYHNTIFPLLSFQWIVFSFLALWTSLIEGFTSPSLSTYYIIRILLCILIGTWIYLQTICEKKEEKEEEDQEKNKNRIHEFFILCFSNLIPFSSFIFLNGYTNQHFCFIRLLALLLWSITRIVLLEIKYDKTKKSTTLLTLELLTSLFLPVQVVTTYSQTFSYFLVLTLFHLWLYFNSYLICILLFCGFVYFKIELVLAAPLQQQLWPFLQSLTLKLQAYLLQLPIQNYPKPLQKLIPILNRLIDHVSSNLFV